MRKELLNCSLTKLFSKIGKHYSTIMCFKLFCSYSRFLCCCSKTKRDEDRIPSLFEIILDPEGELQEEEIDPLFDIVLRPEKFISQSAEEREAEEEEDLPNPSDFNQFRYEFTSSSTTTTTTTTQPRCLKRGHAKPISNFSIPPYHPLLLHCKNHWGRTF